MWRSQIPLWLTLTDVKVRLRMSVKESADEFRDLQQSIERTDMLTYEISALGELSRIIEIHSDNNIDSGEKECDRFSEVRVNLKAENEPTKKYKGTFFYLPRNKAKMPRAEAPNLSLYLNVPEGPFNKFCDALISKRISSLSVGISVKATQDDDVGAFGPPDKDDAIYIETKNGSFDCKLTEIDSIVNDQKS